MKFLRILIGCICLSASVNVAAQTVLDKVSVIVDKGVILESEIRELVKTVKDNANKNNQALPSDRALRTQAIERLILDNLQMQVADRMGIRVSDPQLEQTIANIAQNQNNSVDQLRASIRQAGLDYENYRESVRKELITGEVRRANVRRRIYITPQEISTLVSLIEEQGNEQAEYRLGHILIGFPPEPTDDDITAARNRADKVLNLLNSGSDFAKIAIASSSGPKALDGGDMGWLNINSMPTLFAEVIQGKETDNLIGPIRSGAGFHILKIMETRGVEVAKLEEINARHILIKPSIILSEQKAQSMLLEFKAQILEGTAEFADLAKKHSEDPGSAIKGGDLGWADPNMYVPAFKDALMQLAKDEVSEPVRSVHGWHLMQLLDRRVDDITDRKKQDKAYQLIYNRKFAEETDAWIREMREEAFIEVLDEEGSSD
ncbi:MAG: peptidylprolyl isomerase SurA [Glaciecola sp.]|nr:peptidylprolyl isomerase SurA [Glaciecola sp.]MDG1469662.1 peptidylprolyl isomerase SurA [Glaciecola sp.]MDG1921399.1 peptidylprolyl isomerase SurA [Glaciecola sp.]